jgi:hypothetical protein
VTLSPLLKADSTGDKANNDPDPITNTITPQSIPRQTTDIGFEADPMVDFIAYLPFIITGNASFAGESVLLNDSINW